MSKALRALIVEDSEQDAAEEFLGQPVTKSPTLHELPTCYVQRTDGAKAPRMDGTAVEFWVVDQRLA